jgi:hypothetical protein
LTILAQDHAPAQGALDGLGKLLPVVFQYPLVRLRDAGKHDLHSPLRLP